jgi:hypothetical protein
MATSAYSIYEDEAGRVVYRGGQTNAILFSIDPVTKTMKIVTRQHGRREEHVISVNVPVEIAYAGKATIVPLDLAGLAGAGATE